MYKIRDVDVDDITWGEMWLVVDAVGNEIAVFLYREMAEAFIASLEVSTKLLRGARQGRRQRSGAGLDGRIVSRTVDKLGLGPPA